MTVKNVKSDQEMVRNSKELGNIKSRHWYLNAKPDALIGLIKKPQNFVIIFLDKIYLKTDCNVIGLNNFGHLKPRFF